jgi:serine/threonine-protein kinase
MAVVYEARDAALERPVALKVLDTRQLADSDFAERFLREAKSVARLSHPHIVSVFDVGREGDLAFIVMELLRGGSLQEQLQSAAALDPQRALGILTQLLDALGYAHAVGLVHRDVKPANVMFDAMGRVKLADFGVAKFSEAPERTAVGTVIGTPRYMAPEQLTGAPVGPAADLFAAAALAYRLFTGQHAFGGESMVEIVYAVAHQDPVAPSQLPGPALPAALDAVLLRALAKQPQARYPDAAGFAAALHAAFESGLDAVAMPGGARADPPPPLPPPSGTPSMLAPLLRRLARWWQPAPPPAAAPLPAPAPAPLPAAAEAGADRTLIAPASALPGAPAPAARAAPAAIDGTMILAPASARGVRQMAVQLVITASADARQVGRVVPIGKGEFVLGRGAECQLVLQDYHCSRRHAAIAFDGAGFVVRDLGSVNGTLLDGRALPAATPLPLLFGAAIRIGDTTLTFAPARDTTAPDLTGQLLGGRYRLERVLRASPKATVYQARVGDFGGLVAFKLLAPELADYPGYRERFRQAAAAAARLQHPHICPLQDHGMVDVTIAGRTVATPYLCHSLLMGGSLAARLAEPGPIETALILRWIEQLASALAHAHRQGVWHGDLKPTAVAFDTEGHAYLMDFSFGGGQAGGGEDQPLLGTPAYMAPEQWQGQAATAKTDQFALAALAYSLLTGVRPFVGQEDPATRERNFRRGPAPAHEEARLAGRDDVPRPASEVLERGLASDPEKRYESVDAFAQALAAAFRRAPQQGGAPHVFVSYQHEASAGWAVLLARELRERHGIGAFVDTQRMDAAVQFPAKLESAIRQCDVFVCLLGQTTLQSHWVLQEIRLAHQHQRPMVPVFQESFEQQPREALDPAVAALLQYDGVHLLDRRNIHIDHTIADLARLVTGTWRA